MNKHDLDRHTAPENQVNGAEQAPPGAASRKPYASPRLETFGRLTQLTQATSQATNGDGGSGMMLSSDLRLKQDVVRIGTHPLGMGLYLFNYNDRLGLDLPAGRHFGVLAQEVEAALPAAVSVAANGYMQVDYAQLGIVFAH